MLLREVSIVDKKAHLGGVSIIEMLYKSNIMAIVGSANNKIYPQNKVIIWDDNSAKVVTDISFETHVKAVKLKKDK